MWKSDHIILSWQMGVGGFKTIGQRGVKGGRPVGITNLEQNFTVYFYTVNKGQLDYSDQQSLCRLSLALDKLVLVDRLRVLLVKPVDIWSQPDILSE